MAIVRVLVATEELKECLDKIDKSIASPMPNDARDALLQSQYIVAGVLSWVTEYDNKVAEKKAIRAAQRAQCAADWQRLQIEKEHQEKLDKAILKEKELIDNAPLLFAEVKEDASEKEFQDLKNLLDQWPPAVEPIYICDNNAEVRLDRADQILEMIIGKDTLAGKSFLDFGCGFGDSISAALAKGCTKAMGYDIALESHTENLTTDFNVIKEHGPYDIIMIYDVLDHIFSEDPVAVMRKVREVCKPETRIYVRCHPWSGRHGGHLYAEFNKAYAHLVFTEEELIRLGYTPQQVRKILFPLASYQEIFSKSEFTVEKEILLQEKEKDLFEFPLVKQRIMRHWGNTNLTSFPDLQLSILFVDYILRI